MNRDDYLSQLGDFLSPADRERLLKRDEFNKKLPNLPLANFFNDDLFSLLYRSKEPCSPPLTDVRQLLFTVSGDEPRHVRAAAALALGRFLQKRYAVDNFGICSSHPVQWFQLALQLNSVVAAAELASVFLTQDGLRVELDLDIDPLPQLLEIKESMTHWQPRVSYETANAWYLGTRVGLRHVQRRFSNWDKETFACALSCVTHYLTLFPLQQMSESRGPVAQRRDALLWIKPYWNQLIVAASAQHTDPQAYRDALVEQQLAVMLYLEQDEPPNTMSTKRTPNQKPTRSVRKLRANELIVVPGLIPSSSDRAESNYLKQFEVLQQPMAFKAIPGLEALQAMRTTLCEEFPWAQEAISIVLSDLFARKRHGAMRLGMAPIALVGPPGTGKTRFAQRLSELLGTPNTVINLAGMVDVKVLKGVTRGWSSNRPSRMVEFIQQTNVPNPLFILDEIDKARAQYGNGGNPQDALLDLLEPGNAKRYQDVYLMSECDLSHCLYIATSNSLQALSEPLLSRLRPVLFPPPGPEHAEVILKGIVRDMERSWGLPAGTLTVTSKQTQLMRGLSAREMRRALLEMLGCENDTPLYAKH